MSKTNKALAIVIVILLEAFVVSAWPYDTASFGEYVDAMAGTYEVEGSIEDDAEKAEETQIPEDTAINEPEAIAAAIPQDRSQAAGVAVALDQTYNVTDPQLATDIENGLLVLVNKVNPVGEDYKPEDLADIIYYATDRSAEGRFMRAEAADQFHRLVEDAALAGHEIVMTTAYRSYGFQSVLYNNYVANYGQAEADTFSAQPGKSEHQTGLAVDVSSPSVNYKLTRDYGATEEGMWLAENAHLYGFVLRYPQGGEDITGYMYEPWHIRYVGKTAAEQITDMGVTLEEYIFALKTL